MSDKEVSTTFIHEIIDEHNQNGRFEGRVHTRFPPEPNGYLHIGHAKSICLNYGIATQYGGTYNLRFDDTNPTKEEVEFVESIKEDIRWLGFDWGNRLYFASDYFEQLYQYAVQLIKMGKAFVCELSPDEMREYRGSLTEPGRNSPYRERPIEENLNLFERMRAGEFDEGTHTLRAKIDMASPNISMRDPVLYRILKTSHHRTGDSWVIYPMYDFTHCLSDSLEGITHSICTLEFENNRPLYDWFLDELKVYHPQQIEFARLNMTYTVMSKRKLRRLVEEKIVDGWDDPRMTTLSAMRRRGYTPEAIRKFMDRIGVAKANSTIEFDLFNHTILEDLEPRSPRVMAVLDPLRVVIENYPEDQVEYFDAPYFPQDKENNATRVVPFSRVIYIERDDFLENPPRKFFRLAPGNEVRLMHAYYITCTDVIKDEDNNIIELRCTYDPETRGGMSPDGRRVKGTLHWVSVQHGLQVEARLYDHLFNRPDPENVEDGRDFLDNINLDSLQVIDNCVVEPSLKEAKVGEAYQFIRKGYFCLDSKDSSSDRLIFNRTVSLRDSWAKIQKRAAE